MRRSLICFLSVAYSAAAVTIVFLLGSLFFQHASDVVSELSMDDPAEIVIIESKHLRATASQLDCAFRNYSDTVSQSMVEFGCNVISSTNVSSLKKIGSGYWRDVYKINLNSHDYALKVMKKSHQMTSGNINRHAREYRVLHAIRSSPYVVKAFGYCDATIVSEYVPKGITLETLIAANIDSESINSPNSNISSESQRYADYAGLDRFDQLLIFALDISRSLAALHEIPIWGPVVHADIKPEQFLVVLQDFNGHDIMRAKLNDLNRCRIRQYHALTGDPCPIVISTAKGRWRAPEEYQFDPLTEKIDIYSMGISFWSMIARKKPFSGEKINRNGGYDVVIEGKRPEIMDSWDAEFVSVMTDCWNQNYKLRPTAREVSNRLSSLLKKLYPQYGSLE